jgi:hypothetical protein
MLPTTPLFPLPNAVVPCECGITYHVHHELSLTATAIQVTSVVLDTTCPRCGRSHKVELGKVNFDEKGLGSLLSGEEFTPKVLSDLKTLAEKTLAEPEIAKDFIAAANEIAPKLGDRLDAYLAGQKNIMELIKLLLTILTAALATMGYFKNKPAPTPTTVNNTYNFPIASPLSARQMDELRKIQSQASPQKRSNLTPPKKRKPRKK